MQIPPVSCLPSFSWWRGKNEKEEKTFPFWARKLGVTIILKGNETIIAFPDGDCRMNGTGNSSLAKGGSGDTLTGMILGMLCCHENPKIAVLNAVHLHGACADEWTKKRSAHTLLAHELSELLPAVWKDYE
jgi:ADP-dependent NAD(P)H-hydrate dehydratase